MHMPTYRRATATALALVMSTTVALAAAPQYTMQVIEPPAPYEWALGSKINANGDVLVTFLDLDDGLESHGVLTSQGQWIPIVAPGGVELTTRAMNDRRQVVGLATDGGFIWSPEAGWKTIAPKIGYFDAGPSSINNQGVVVGTVSQGAANGPLRAFYWAAEAGMRILKPNLSATPEAINNKNQTVGTVRFSNAYSSGSNAVVLRPHHQPIRLGDLRDIPGRPDSGGSDINEIGTVLLTAVGDGNIGQVALWTAREGLRSIGLPGRPYAINNRNEVVASSGSAAGDIGFFWRDDVGLVRLLDALVSGSPMFDTIAGFDINDSGMISGTATRNAGAIRVAVVLTPVTPAK